MSMPLPPVEAMRQMRFSPDFWMCFFSTLREFDDEKLIDLSNLDNLDEPSVGLFFTTLAARMIEIAGADDMPTLDDTVIMVKVILEEELKERMVQAMMEQIFDRMGDK